MSITTSVSNLTELYNALSTATRGETIELAGGNYGKMSLNKKLGFDLTFPKGVTITSADPDNPAVFSGLDIREVSNLTFDAVTFDYTFQSGDKIFSRPFSVVGSENVTIRNSTFDGDLASGVSEIDDGFGYAIGLSVRKSQGFNLENNEFFDFHRGATFSDSGDVAVTGNDIHSIRMDGLNFSQIDGANIEDNYIHDFRGSKKSLDHSDMIQFWTNGTDSPSKDIVIRGNHLDIGEGNFTQSIFMRNDVVDQGKAGTEMFYQDITIENNTIINGHSHGITVGETNGLVIKSNTVLHADGDMQDGLDHKIEVPRINVAADSTNVKIQSNVTANITGQEGQPDWSVRQNAFVQDQDPNAPGYYGDVFVASTLDLVDGVHQVRALDGSMVDTLGAGAPALYEIPQNAGPIAQFHVTPNPENMSEYHFDASFSMSDGKPLPAGSVYLWTFGDGTTSTGAQVSHAFPEGGAYDVALSIKLPDGSSSGRALNLDVVDSNLISTADGVGADTAISGLEKIDLGGAGPSLTVAREHVANLLNQDEFSISMSIAATTAKSMGEIGRLHGSFIVEVNDDGNLKLRIFQDNGEHLKITTEGVTLNDTASHDVDISLKDGVLDVMVDKVVVSSTEMSGTLASNGTHDLSFGNPFGGKNFVGALSDFEITVNDSHFNKASDMAVAPTPKEIPPIESLVLFNQEAQAAAANTVENEAPIASGEVAREEVSHVLGKDTFEISFGLGAVGSDGAGEVMRLHQSFVVSVTDKGELYTQLFDTDGNRIRLTTEGANLTDSISHDINISYKDNLVEIYVDGKVLSSAEMANPLANAGRHDLVFGNPWKDDKFDGPISGLKMTTVDEFYEMAPLSAQIKSSAPYSEMLNLNLIAPEVGERVDQFENMGDHLQISFFE